MTLVVNILTLIVVGGYAYFAYQQTRATQHLVTISQNQQRPYLWARPIPRNPGGIIFRALPGPPVHDSRDMNFAIEADAEIRNSGLSPAIDVVETTPNITMEPRNFFTWKTVRMHYLDYPEVAGGAVIGASSSILVKAGSQGANGLTMEGVWGDQEIAFMVGKVKYTDIYHPNERPYETSYCFVLKPQPITPNPGGTPETDIIGSCPFGNHFQ